MRIQFIFIISIITISFGHVVDTNQMETKFGTQHWKYFYYLMHIFLFACFIATELKTV